VERLSVTFTFFTLTSWFRVLRSMRPHFHNTGGLQLIGDAYDSLPPRSRGEARASVSTARAVQSYLNEFIQGATVMQQAAALDDFADKPLIVVTAGRGSDEAWLAAQDKLATLSTNSRHRVVAEATHASLILEETHAAAASQGIRDVVKAVRTSQPLA